MKITMTTKDFKDAVLKVVLAAPVKAQTPILYGMFIRTTDKPHPSVILECNDFTNCIKARIPAEFDSAGICVIPARLVAQIVPKLSGALVTVETADTQVIIESESAKFQLYTMNAEEFPEFKPVAEVDGRFRTSISDFKETVRRTIFACTANDNARPFFKSAHFIIDGDKLTSASTNTHRLAVASTELLEEVENPADLIVPDTALNNALSTLPDDDGKITCEYKENFFGIYSGNVRIYTRLLDGTFPPHEKIIPTEINATAKVDIKTLKKALERANLISAKAEYRTVSFNIDEGGLSLTAVAHQAGDFNEHVDAETSGEISIAFNIDYLQDFLKLFGDGSLNIEVTEPLAPAKITVEGIDNFVYVVTPIRTR